MAASLHGEHVWSLVATQFSDIYRAPTLLDRGEARVKVDLDRDRPADKKRDNLFYCIIIKQTTEIKMVALQAYLGGKMSWDTSVLECMSES